MKHSIFAIITTIGLAISAAAPASAFAENFEHGLKHDQIQASTNTHPGQSEFQQRKNAAMNGKNKLLIASYNVDKNAFQRHSILTSAFDEQILAMELPMIQKMVGVKSRSSSEYNDKKLRFCTTN